MSRFWATCFGSSEDQSSPHRRRRRRHHDSETESSYDSDDESESDDAEDDRFSRLERGEARFGTFRREEDMRLEEVLSAEEENNRYGKNEVRGNISVVDSGPPLLAAAPPIVSRFVQHVLRESQKGYRQRTQGTNSPSTAKDVLPQVSLLHEANKVLPDASPAFFQPAKSMLEDRMSSGGSISSSGGESGRSSTSSGIGDSFTSGNDTGGSGATGGKKNSRGNAMKAVDGSRGKAKSNGEWSQGILQDVVVEEDEVTGGIGHMSHFMAGGRRGGAERSSVATVEGVHLPNVAAREWGAAARLANSEPPGGTASKIVKAFNRNRIGHHPNMVRVEDYPKTKGTSTNLNVHLDHAIENFKGINNQFTYFSTLPKTARNDISPRQSIMKY